MEVYGDELLTVGDVRGELAALVRGGRQTQRFGGDEAGSAVGSK